MNSTQFPPLRSESPSACVHEIAAEPKCANYGRERATLQVPEKNLEANMQAREGNAPSSALKSREAVSF